MGGEGEHYEGAEGAAEGGKTHNVGSTQPCVCGCVVEE